jgi:hypothetical protein
VPPPPAAGAALGNGLADELAGVAAGAVPGVLNTVDEGLLDGVAPCVAVPAGVAVRVAVPVALVLGAEPVAVVVGKVTEPEPDTDTEGMVGAVVEGPPEHAATAVEASRASAQPPSSLAPAWIVRSFIEPPRPPYAIVRFLAQASQTRAARNNARWFRSILVLAKGRFPKTPATI